MPKDKHAPVAIIGAGPWGLSTAYHLVQQGYDDITVFERSWKIPSPYSAGNDLNKIVRSQYDTDFYTELGLEAIEGWKTPDFSPYYHQTGHLVTVSGQASLKATQHHEEAFEYVTKHPVLSRGVQPINTRAQFQEYAWQLSGPLKGFKGYFNRLEGYAHSANALRGIYTLLAGRGVKFLLGPEIGHVVELIYDSPLVSSSSRSSRCTGVRTRDGKAHAVQTTICALGAYGASLIPLLGSFNVARCWSVAHIQLTQRECDILRGLPVVNVRDLGFYFEPDPETRLLKLCPLGAGFSNPDTKTGISLPPATDTPLLHDYIPLEDEQKLRTLLCETLTWLADRPFINNKLCWFSDTCDSEYCIDFVPGTGGSLVVLSGDSGHGFKMMPIFGKWVVELLDRGEQQIPRWRWRDTATEGSKDNDWGNDVSWRFGEAKTINEIVEERKNQNCGAKASSRSRL
ncbi:uncharacterized protein Z518_05105 [Rhinocladiella mackenziei CBS 650.93]|uniref:Rhinocladiella mackenziei CBS 650.93 unplaced genomic scaffold supercont1.3, whole genome shotgun sequence n=1 Tax=Rhinocladiella mackenziei CBS 650.93 TaxID=1442369 RepID=A0A0D2H9G2_9EURO|nr:uncharacterized protein Z518_05105 [Rhinocladiella mackenziei CBS 650.93]KIX07128.1 hypothetical protein Z518_05105 [Rhinocladiella mackenziei CBS 650.93]